jgi:hypothetical protein
MRLEKGNAHPLHNILFRVPLKSIEAPESARWEWHLNPWMEKIVNNKQIEESNKLLGDQTVEMLLKVHEDALWILENMGVGCKQPDILELFKKYENDGLAVVYDNRIYLMEDLVKELLESVPGIKDFFVPKNSFLVGGTAPYIYDDKTGAGGVMPTPEHVKKIAQIAESTDIIAGMGRGVNSKMNPNKWISWWKTVPNRYILQSPTTNHWQGLVKFIKPAKTS